MEGVVPTTGSVIPPPTETVDPTVKTTSTETPKEEKPKEEGIQAFRFTCSGKGLDKRDGPFRKSDPYLVISRKDPKYFDPIVLYRSEYIKQNLNPTWQAFELDVEMCGGLDQPILFECYDWDADGNDDLIGQFQVTLRELTMPHNVFSFINPEKKGRFFYRNSGQFVVNVTEPFQRKKLGAKGYLISFEAKDVDRKDLGGLGKSDPFLLIKGKPLLSGSYPPLPDNLKPPKAVTHSIVIAQTEVLKNEVNPSWKPLQLDISVCGGLDSPLTVECYDWDENGKVNLIGETPTITLRQLTNPNPQFALIHHDKKGGLLYKNSGVLHVTSCSMVNESNAIPAAQFKLKCHSKGVDIKDLNFKSDPFFIVLARPYLGFSKPGYVPEEPKVAPAHPPIVTQQKQQVVVAPPPTKKPEKSSGKQSTKKPSSPANQKSSDGKQEATTAKTEVQKPIPTLPPPQQQADPMFPIYRSEVIYKSLNPDWSQFTLDLFACGGMDGELVFQFWDFDSDGGHDWIGSLKTTLRQLLHSNEGLRIVNQGKEGRMFYGNSGKFFTECTPDNSITIDEFIKKSLPKEYVLRIRAEKLDRKDFFSKSDPFLRISAKSYNSKQPIVVYKSEVIKNSHEPSWQQFKLDVVTCGGFDSELLIEVMDEDNNGKPELIGQFKSTLRELACFKTFPCYYLINPDYLRDKTFYSHSGIVTIEQCDPWYPEDKLPAQN